MVEQAACCDRWFGAELLPSGQAVLEGTLAGRAPDRLCTVLSGYTCVGLTVSADAPLPSSNHATDDSFCPTPFNNTHAHTHYSHQLGKQQRQQVRMLNVHEYVGSDIMKSFGIETPVVGRLLFSVCLSYVLRLPDVALLPKSNPN